MLFGRCVLGFFGWGVVGDWAQQREEHHVADRLAVGQQHDHAVDADAHAAGGGHAVLERGDWDPHVALVGAHYFVGVMSLAAQGLWHQLPVAGLNRAADEGFLRTQDGIWLMGYGRQNGNFACVEVASGDLRWELPIQATASDVITMDVDGDGHQEFVFATSHGHLWAVGDDGDRPRVVWRADLPAGGSGPIAADVDGDGVSEIVLTTVDGYVTVLK